METLAAEDVDLNAQGEQRGRGRADQKDGKARVNSRQRNYPNSQTNGGNLGQANKAGSYRNKDMNNPSKGRKDGNYNRKDSEEKDRKDTKPKTPAVKLVMEVDFPMLGEQANKTSPNPKQTGTSEFSCMTTRPSLLTLILRRLCLRSEESRWGGRRRGAHLFCFDF